MHHELHDEVGLEIAKRVVVQLRSNPDLLNFARTNVKAWRQRNTDAPALLACYKEWEELLNKPMEIICSNLCSETEEGCRLRQNSPFAGLLPPQEIWDIKRTTRARYAKSAA
ncbi:MAG: hypothetical protein JNN07_13330 [Verrucomicrobiales bacterium]|nr:hypothetical protein [Verrucomicrobiales bacterium]